VEQLERRFRGLGRPAVGAAVVLGCLLLLAAASTPNLIFFDNPVLDFTVRKLGHLLVYSAIAFGASITLSGRLRQSQTAWVVLGGAVALALLDERIQWHVIGRMSSPFDVALDILGAVLGIVVWMRFERRRAARS
jgi:VanZ family protein